MHDIDRTQTGLGCDGYEMENDPYSSGEAPYSGGQANFPGNDEMQLAANLMEVNTEEEFENFLGDLLSQATSAIGGILSPPVGQALGGFLKGAARQVLPVAQQHHHHHHHYEPGFQGGPMFETGGPNDPAAEMEEREWEAARTFVKLAQEAATSAATAPAGADPNATAHKAMVDAAQKVVPALLAPANAPQPPRPEPHHHHGMHEHGMHEHGGRWVRRGNQIILYGV